MFRYIFLVVGLISYFVAQSNGYDVSFIKPCKAEDKECIKTNAQNAVPYFAKGMPELGVPVTDPIAVDAVTTDEPSLQLAFKNITVTGVSKCQIIELERNTEKSSIRMVAECPIHGTGQYHLKGKLLFIEAFGDGDFTINTDKVKIDIELLIKDIVKDGHKYWKVTSFDYKYDLIDKVKIALTNLYDGDETRAKPLEEVLKNSSNELVNEVGAPMIRQLLSKYVECVKAFLLHVPADMLEVV